MQPNINPTKRYTKKKLGLTIRILFMCLQNPRVLFPCPLTSYENWYPYTNFEYTTWNISFEDTVRGLLVLYSISFDDCLMKLFHTAFKKLQFQFYSLIQHLYRNTKYSSLIESSCAAASYCETDLSWETALSYQGTMFCELAPFSPFEAA